MKSEFNIKILRKAAKTQPIFFLLSRPVSSFLFNRTANKRNGFKIIYFLHYNTAFDAAYNLKKNNVNN